MASQYNQVRPYQKRLQQMYQPWRYSPSDEWRPSAPYQKGSYRGNNWRPPRYRSHPHACQWGVPPPYQIQRDTYTSMRPPYGYPNISNSGRYRTIHPAAPPSAPPSSPKACVEKSDQETQTFPDDLLITSSSTSYKRRREFDDDLGPPRKKLHIDFVDTCRMEVPMEVD